MSKDRNLSGQCYDIETNEGAMLELCLTPRSDHYAISLRDTVTGQDALPVLCNPASLPDIFTLNDVNIALQIIFADSDDIPQIDAETPISDWERGLEFDELDSIEQQGRYLQDVGSVVRDLQETTLSEAIDRSGEKYYFRFGDLVIECSFRYSPSDD